MKANLPWDDLALFAMVARAGALIPASQTTGVSPATLSRRMTALENHMGRRLFHRGSDGYAITSDGRALLAKTEKMEAAAAHITQWQNTISGPIRVRISAGTWTALQLADNLQEFWKPDCKWVPEFLHCNLDMDIARREIDIGIRNKRPEQPWLAGRKTGDVQFAVFAKSADVSAWIGASYDAAATPSAKWVKAHYEDKIETTANDPRLALAMAEAGIGRIILPVFVGRTIKTLVQLTDPIEELNSEQWIVCHHDGRHETAVRQALDALQRFLTRRIPET